MPVTPKPFNDDTSKLQFAIISDLWGGLRPRVFDDAVEKLGLLQPQFVISVGDLIDGKSYEPSEINKQWDEFDRSIRPLTMPFFYVPGNHDISNAVMENEWKKRLGSPYYHFVYKNVLFLCINTEDGGKGGIRDEQVAYFKKALEANTTVRWTFLFMHRPVWQGKGDRQEGYEKIERLLNDRNYTLFSGHHHTYLSLTKNGKKHFVLGSTGGGSDLRGEKFGEFDHLTLVTLANDEPKIINLKLDGLIKEDVVNEKTHPLTQTLINQDWLVPVASVSNTQKEKKIQAQILFDNPTDQSLKITGNFNKHLKDYVITPAIVNVEIAPKTKVSQPIVLTKKDKSLIDLASLQEIDIELTGEYVYGSTNFAIPARKKLLLSWKLPVIERENKKNRPINLYQEIDTSEMIYLTKAEQVNGHWYWSGSNDCLVRFKVEKDKSYVYVTALVSDDQWVNDAGSAKDMFYLHLEEAAGKQTIAGISPRDETCKVEGSFNAGDIVTRKFFSDNILLLEFRMPLDKLIKPDRTIRLNFSYRDQDNVPEKNVSTLFWKPQWNSANNYKNSGTFIIK